MDISQDLSNSNSNGSKIHRSRSHSRNNESKRRKSRSNSPRSKPVQSVKKDAYPIDNTSMCLWDPLLVVIIYCYKFKDDFNEAIFFLMLRISKESKVSVDGDKAGDEVT